MEYCSLLFICVFVVKCVTYNVSLCPLELLLHLSVLGKVLGNNSSYSPAQERRASVSPSLCLICLPLTNKLFASVVSFL